MNNQEIDKDIEEFIKFERKYYTPSGIMDAVLSVSAAESAFKTLLMCKHLEDFQPEYADLLTPDMANTFELLRQHCADFIKTYDLYETELLEDIGDTKDG